MARNQLAGRRAETAACRYLQRRGLRLLARNYRCRVGEIDLIMGDGDSLVFVEVRYRRSVRFGGAAESIDRRKQARIIACASHYLQQHPGLAARPARFDVVAIAADDQVSWIPDAFQS
ncbi:MAG TPA: YraN family protein [Gammaproteobacteria bacterium]|nr:YraN family protein [Gammaproteobacteria bacterium]